MLNCWYEDPHQRPRFSSLVQGFSDMLEEEAGYFNLSRSLSWKKEPEQRSVASPAGPALLTIEEGEEEGEEMGGEEGEEVGGEEGGEKGGEEDEGRKGIEGRTGEDVELENLASGVKREDVHTPPESISSF